MILAALIAEAAGAPPPAPATPWAGGQRDLPQRQRVEWQAAPPSRVTERASRALLPQPSDAPPLPRGTNSLHCRIRAGPTTAANATEERTSSTAKATATARRRRLTTTTGIGERGQQDEDGRRGRLMRCSGEAGMATNWSAGEPAVTRRASNEARQRKRHTDGQATRHRLRHLAATPTRRHGDTTTTTTARRTRASQNKINTRARRRH